MSSPYPVLGNKPIDQWKVTELKEELKRRKLTTKGLKDDLIKRLDEALRFESQPRAEIEANKQVVSPQVAGKLNVARSGKAEIKEADTVRVQSNSKTKSERKNVEVSPMIQSSGALVDASVPETITPVKIVEEVVSHEAAGDLNSGDGLRNSSALEHSGRSPISEAVEYKSVGAELEMEKIEALPLLEDDGMKVTKEDESSCLANQVSEVSHNLGFPVKSDSISTDSVSINEKIELKDNKIDDTVKLELDGMQRDSVEPSSGNIVPVDGESHPMDGEEPQEKALLPEENGLTSTDADASKKTETVDLGDSEKLNLDRSPGDDSMEEDMVDTNQIVSPKDQYFENKAAKEETKESLEQNQVDTKKREHYDELSENVESAKRQRRWNSERILEEQKDDLASTTPKEPLLSAPKRSFLRTDSSVSEEAPKERVVPPSQKPATNSLRIDRFLRPFTLKAVQELLGKTGTVEKFWMDQIKTHCYVTYSSAEEALETRNALYNLQWPPNGGRPLVAEFVEPQEVVIRVEGPPDGLPSAPVTPSATAGMGQSQPFQRQMGLRQRISSPPLPPPPPLANTQDPGPRLLPPPPPEKADTPLVTLDDLFRKTKATPRIYYLPLTEEQVSAKLADSKQ